MKFRAIYTYRCVHSLPYIECWPAHTYINTAVLVHCMAQPGNYKSVLPVRCNVGYFQRLD